AMDNLIFNDFVKKNMKFSLTKMLSIDKFNYIKNGFNASECEKKEVSDLDNVFNQGIHISKLNNISVNMPAVLRDNKEFLDIVKMDSEFLYYNIDKPTSSLVKFCLSNNGKFVIESKLTDDKYKYYYFKESFARDKFNMTINSQFLLKCDHNFSKLETVFEFQDNSKNKISHSINIVGGIHSLAIPKECSYIRFGIKITGKGKAEISSLILDFLSSEPFLNLSKSKIMILTKQYPSYGDLYKYGFLHSRVKAYKENGVIVDVFKISNTERYSCREFEDIDVITASNEVLEETLRSGQYDHILVHFLDKNMWSILEKFIDKIKVTVWIHGAEIQIWQRRQFEFKRYDNNEIDRQKRLSDDRVKFWKNIINKNYQNLHFVFVSEYFKNESLTDLGITLERNKYSIIHNPIDISLFNYVKKTPEFRKKILSIR
ncbi:methyltransferase type 12, partial [Campylobacter lari]|nr:methyltransferase type 12 [Campylobacter lari]